jgi:hypothetical protein
VEPLISFARENVILFAILAVIFLPVAIIFQKSVAPLIFHTAEYILYVTLSHYILYAMVQTAAWYKDAAGGVIKTDDVYTTPMNPLTENFFDKSLYNPTGLFYFELLMVFGFLYLVVVVRPTSYSGSNTYKGDSERGMTAAEKRNQRAGRYNRNRAKTSKSKR